MRYKFIIGVVVAVVLAAAPSVYFYRQYRATQQRLTNPTEYAREEAKLILEKLGKLIELPPGEDPTIATVTDATKLTDQPFFANAQNGDKVIIYTKAKKAILYRVETNKIIDVAPVNIGSNATPSAQTISTPSAQPNAGQPLVGTPTPSAAPQIIIQ